MRVLLVADIVGGVRTFALELARAMPSEVELHLALLGDPADADPFRALRPASCQVSPLALEWMPEPWSDVRRAQEWIAELCRRHRPDLAHLNTFTPVSDPDMPVLLSVHSCVLSWWRAVHGIDAPPRWNRYRSLASTALARAGVVVTPTQALMDQLRSIYGALPPARVIANGSSADAAAGSGGPRERLVLCAGRLWDEGKNVRVLAQAAPLIEARVAVIGDGQAAGLQQLGRLAHAEVVPWLSRAAVFAEPARYEPFGLAALEAARCGCALVLGDIASLREVWGSAAAYVSPDDPQTLAATVNHLLDDPGRLNRAARAAGEAAAGYTPEAMATGYLDAYRTLLAAPVSA